MKAMIPSHSLVWSNFHRAVRFHPIMGPKLSDGASYGKNSSRIIFGNVRGESGGSCQRIFFVRAGPAGETRSVIVDELFFWLLNLGQSSGEESLRDWMDKREITELGAA